MPRLADPLARLRGRSSTTTTRAGTLPDDAHLLVGGGGQDSGQVRVEDDLGRSPTGCGAWPRTATPMLMICGMYQLFGNAFITVEGQAPARPRHPRRDHAGQRQADDRPGRARHRAYGDVVGYENHSGSTVLGAGQAPFGTVRAGLGNNGTDGTEGAVTGNVFGSYLHGPILPANPGFADAPDRPGRAAGPPVARSSRPTWTTPSPTRRGCARYGGSPADPPSAGRRSPGVARPRRRGLARCGCRGRRWRRLLRLVRRRRRARPRCGGRQRLVLARHAPGQPARAPRAGSPSGGCRPRTATTPASAPAGAAPQATSAAAVPDSVTPTPPGVMPTAVSRRPTA